MKNEIAIPKELLKAYDKVAKTFEEMDSSIGDARSGNYSIHWKAISKVRSALSKLEAIKKEFGYK